MKAPTLVTNTMIWEEIQKMKFLFGISQENKIVNDLQEFTLNQTAKILRMSTETLRIKAENQEIESLIDEKSNAKGGVTFKFTSIHIKEFQERRRFNGLKSKQLREDFNKIINNEY